MNDTNEYTATLGMFEYSITRIPDKAHTFLFEHSARAVSMELEAQFPQVDFRVVSRNNAFAIRCYWGKDIDSFMGYLSGFQWKH